MPANDELLDEMHDRSLGMTCSRCGQRTGNNTQGHYWKRCSVTKTFREFHFCCPGNCQLDEDGS